MRVSKGFKLGYVNGDLRILIEDKPNQITFMEGKDKENVKRNK